MTHDLRLERLIDGTPAEVFAAFTEAEAMTQWYEDNPGWVVDVRAADVRVGGTTIVAFGPGGEEPYCEAMTYSEVDVAARLAYLEVFRMPDGSTFETNIVVTFEAQNDKTLMTIFQTGFPSAEQRDAHQGGWPNFIDRLEQVVTKRRTS